MQYLNKRNDFLNNRRNDLFKINEDSFYSDVNSGPFANNLGWHDSLVGRLIDNMIRKAKIKAGAVRMKPLIKRLEEEFELVNSQGLATQLTSEDKETLEKVKIYRLFDVLIKAVDAGEEVSSLKNLTDSAIKTVNEMEFQEKESILKELKDFREFLEQFKDDTKLENDDSTEDTEDSEASIYPQMVKNLKSLSLILSNYKKVKFNVNNSKYKYTTKEGDTITKIVSNPQINKKNIEVTHLRSKNPILSTYKDDVALKAGLELVMENLNLFEDNSNRFGTGGGSDRADIKGTEDHLSQAFSKLKKDIEVLISPKEKGIAVDINFINDITANSNDTKSKEVIKSLYSEIKRYLVGDKKNTLQEKDALYKESIDVISDNNKKVIVAEKIARFAKRVLQFKGTGLESGLGDLKAPIQDFINSLSIILKEGKKQSITERTLLRYDGYIKYIKEDENKESEEETSASDPVVKDRSTKIKDYFDKNCKGVKAFVVEKTEIDKVSKNLEKVENQKENFVIDGIDPIVEICKLFNRAFKIYIVRTKREITKRTDPQHSSAFTEYTVLGGESGPWRNNKLFDMWENAVNDIIKQRKFQHIFLPTTTLRIPNIPNPKTKDDYSYIEKAGANLRKFMLDLLDGDDLYKAGSEKGAQKVFLNKYFGDEITNQIDKSNVKLGYSGDDKNNIELSNIITENEIKLRVSRIEKPNNLTERTFIIIDGVNDEDKPIQRTFFINDFRNDVIYLSYCTSFGPYKKYLDKLPNQKKIDKGDFTRDLLMDRNHNIKYTKISANDFRSLLKDGGNFTIKGITKDNKSSETNIKIIKSYWLTKEDKSIYQVNKEIRDEIKKDGEKSDIKSFIDSSSEKDSIKITKA